MIFLKVDSIFNIIINFFLLSYSLLLIENFIILFFVGSKTMHFCAS